MRVEEWASPPAPPPGWVTVAVSYCGICGTDLEEYQQGPIYIPEQPHPLTGRQLPLVLGHEVVGRIVAVGDGAAFSSGDRVALENSVGCGECEACRAGQVQLCVQMAVVGLMLDGGLAERVNVPASLCVPISDRLPDVAGAVAEPLSVAVRAVRRGGDVRGQDVQVIGGGAVGLLAAQVARSQSARSVVVREPAAWRRSVASALGFETAADGEYPGRAPIVLECSGTAAGFRDALTATAKSGVTVVVGIHALPQEVDLKSMLLDERSIVASLSHSLRDDYLPAIELLESGAIDFEPLITEIVPLDRALDGGFNRLAGAGEPALKLLVDCR